MKPAALNDYLHRVWSIHGSPLGSGKYWAMSTCEARLHELAHWFALGESRPSNEIERDGAITLFAIGGDASSIDGIIEDRLNALSDVKANNQELRAISIEIIALKRLDLWKYIRKSNLFEKCWEGLRHSEKKYSSVDLVVDEIDRLMKTPRVKRLAKRLVKTILDNEYAIEDG